MDRDMKKEESVITSSSLLDELNRERNEEGKSNLRPINTVSGSGLSSNSLARKDKSFGNFIDFFAKLIKKQY